MPVPLSRILISMLGPSTVLTLFADSIFSVPPYQRAYAVLTTIVAKATQLSRTEAGAIARLAPVLPARLWTDQTFTGKLIPAFLSHPASGSRTRLHAFAFACNAFCSF
jgi:hypothetical protein